MKVAKLVIGIISIVLTLVIFFQSCAASIGDALMEEGGTSGASGILVAILMLVAGIVAIAARNSRGGSIACTIIYALAGILGVASQGIYADLKIWGAVCLVFAVFFLVDVIISRKQEAKQEESASSAEV